MTQKFKVTMDVDDDNDDDYDDGKVNDNTQPEFYCYCRTAEVEGEPMIACDVR